MNPIEFESDVDNQQLAVDERTAARLLSMSPRNVFELRKSGSMPHIRVGKLIRYLVSDLKKFAEERRVVGSPIESEAA